MKGFFITLEGGDGVGKTTQAQLLQDQIRACGLNCLKLREPGSTPTCESIRNVLKTPNVARVAEVLLFNAARNQLIEEVIRPALEAGDVIVCDRFLDSTVAYQHFANRLPFEMVQHIIAYAVGDVLPHLTILLELSEEEAAQRAAHSDGRDGIKKYDLADADFKARVLSGYQYQANVHPTRIMKVSAHGSVEEVQTRVWDLVKQKLVAAGLLGA